MHASASPLPIESRTLIAQNLNARLIDGLDLQSQTKVAHWNVKGPQFPVLHPLFETFASELAGFNDAIAERAVTLGALATGTSRHIAQHSPAEKQAIRCASMFQSAGSRPVARPHAGAGAAGAGAAGLKVRCVTQAPVPVMLGS